MSIERACLSIERELRKATFLPVVGVIPAVVKIVLGILQASLGILFTLLSVPFACCNERAKDFCKRAHSHIIHGAANVIAGLVEITPFWTILHFSVGNIDNLYGAQRDKIIPYKILILQDPLNYHPGEIAEFAI